MRTLVAKLYKMFYFGSLIFANIRHTNFKINKNKAEKNYKI